MGRFVLDCSVTMTWCFGDQRTDLSAAVLESLSRSIALVPGIWSLEVVNVLVQAERKSRIQRAQTDEFLNQLIKLPIQVAADSRPLHFSRVLGVARDQGLSSYDASYLDLALREQIPLVTLDEKLAKAAKDLKLPKFKVS